MAKDTFSPTQACAAKTLYVVMQEMKRRGGSMPVKDLYPYVEANVPLTEWEKEAAGKMGYIRWTNAFQFYSIDYVKAGFLQKKNGFWYLTPEGDAAISKGCDEMMRLANAAYDEWKRNQDATKPDDEPTVENPTPAATTAMNLELLESDAHEGIKKYVAAKGPYEFQEIVAALLRAMGYHTPFIAPKGKDGGVDIIAYVDPLGAQTPRIKVQVKHKPDTVIGAPDVRALLGIMRDGDIALFVTSGTFSPDARTTATTSPKFVRLIDGNEFIEMWQEYYDKMSDDDKNMLPLKRIAFLGNND